MLRPPLKLIRPGFSLFYRYGADSPQPDAAQIVDVVSLSKVWTAKNKNGVIQKTALRSDDLKRRRSQELTRVARFL
jgi:hypothetical protein